MLTSLFPSPDDIPESLRIDAPLDQRHYLLNGHMREWSGPVRPIYSPIAIQQPDGSAQPVLLGSQPDMSADDALAALDAARHAYDRGRGRWPTMTVRERMAAVGRFAHLLLARRDDIVKLIVWEIGKSVPDAEKEFDRTIDYIHATINALRDLDNASGRFVEEDGVIAQIRRTPLGVVLCMGPFNYPMNETFTTLIPALIMGNTVVVKPAKHGTLLWAPMMQAFCDAFPAGVVNIVHGSGEALVTPMMASGGVDVLAFIGSSRVASALKKHHPKPNRLRGVLGLDAKNAGIILPDADLDLTIKECITGTLSFNGQRCTALKILLVHRDILPRFLERFSAALEQITIGMPWTPGVQITPLAEPGKPDRLSALIDDAVAHGAHIINPGGGAHTGSLFRPALVCPVDARMRLYHEEQFGPVIPVVPFDTLDDAISYVANSPFGQQASIFGQAPRDTAQLIDALVNQVCRVNLNTQCQRGPDIYPFAGRKDSAESTLSVSDALRAFSIRSMVATKRSEASTAQLEHILDQRCSRFVTTGYLL